MDNTTIWMVLGINTLVGASAPVHAVFGVYPTKELAIARLRGLEAQYEEYGIGPGYAWLMPIHDVQAIGKDCFLPIM